MFFQKRAKMSRDLNQNVAAAKWKKPTHRTSQASARQEEPRPTPLWNNFFWLPFLLVGSGLGCLPVHLRGRFCVCGGLLKKKMKILKKKKKRKKILPRLMTAEPTHWGRFAAHNGPPFKKKKKMGANFCLENSVDQTPHRASWKADGHVHNLNFCWRKCSFH